jgi:general secretion pathway protein A
MYEAYWGLRTRPFDNTFDPRFFFGSREHAEAFARLLYVCEQRLGGGLLTGVPGTGKSLVARALASSLPTEDYQVGICTAPYAGAQDTILAVLASLGEQEVPRTIDRLTKQAVAESLERRLSDAELAGRHVVVIIDDADQLADDNALGMCRFLMGRMKSNRFRLTLLLVGNDTLNQRINTEHNRALDARLAVKYHLRGLNAAQAKAYILHRLKTAGSRRGIFTADAATRIVSVSHGIPAFINRLCDLSLLAGYGLGADRIMPEIVDTVLHQIGGEMPGQQAAALQHAGYL